MAKDKTLSEAHEYITTLEDYLARLREAILEDVKVFEEVTGEDSEDIFFLSLEELDRVKDNGVVNKPNKGEKCYGER